MKTFTVPKYLRHRVEKVAERDGVSFDEAMREVLELGLTAHEEYANELAEADSTDDLQEPHSDV